MPTYTYSTLDDPASYSFGGISGYTWATGINDSGQVVGYFFSESALQIVGFVETDGTYTTINSPANSLYLSGINNAGEVVGHYNGWDGQAYGFGSGNFSAAWHIGYGINDAGQIVGDYVDGGRSLGFLYSGGTYTTINDPLATSRNDVVTSTHAAGINDAGVIVGYYYDDNLVAHGFTYSGGAYSTLDDPLATRGTVVTGINNNGEIVGHYSDDSGTYGFLYNAGTFITLTDSLAASATGINDEGQLVGYFQDSTGNHGWIATPTPMDQPPVISSVSDTPSTAELGPGNTVTLTVNFSGAVTVAGGTPTLALNDGGVAFYKSGSGSNALVFTYTVGAFGSGQNTPDLALAATNALSLNGATITDAFGTAADLNGANGFNPAGTLQIDTTAPAVSSITAVTDNGLKDLNAGHVITITVGTSEVVNVTGTPMLQLNDNEVATYISGTGTNTLKFAYTVKQGDTALDLQVTGLVPNANAAVQDGAGNSLSGAVTQDLALKINTVDPIVTALSTSAASNDLNAGKKVAFTLTMSGPVKVKGTPTLSLNDGGTANYSAAASNPATGILVFNYTVKVGQNIRNLHVDSVNLATGVSVTDAGGRSADFANALTALTGLQIDTTAPTVSMISASPSNGVLNVGSMVAITLTMSETVNVTGTPALKLNDGGTATYVSGSGTGALVFDYTVANSDKPTFDLQVSKIVLSSGASITDLAENRPATTDLTGVTGANLGLQVDTKAILSVTALSADLNDGISEYTPFTFLVTRTGNSATTASVKWMVSTNQDPAADAKDFVGGRFPSGTVSFLPGETSKTISVNVAPQTFPENGGLPENFTVSLSNASGTTTINPLSASASGTIFDGVLIPFMAKMADASYHLAPAELATPGFNNPGGPEADTLYSNLTKLSGFHLLTASDPDMASLKPQQVNNSAFKLLGLQNGIYANANAAALIGTENGSLYIAFRGTNDKPAGDNIVTDLVNGYLGESTPDINNWFNMAKYYQLLEPLLTAVDSYISDPNNTITNVYVTGHSLGAAMVQRYLSDSNHLADLNGNQDLRFEGVTFADPGYVVPADSTETVPSGADARIINVHVAGDPASNAEWLAPYAGFKDGEAGDSIVVDHPSIAGSPDLHSMALYYAVAGFVGNNETIGLPAFDNIQDTRSIQANISYNQTNSTWSATAANSPV